MKTFKSADQAFDYMLGVVEKIKNKGISVTINQWYKEDEKSEHQDHCIKQYNGDECASYLKWCNICFTPKTKEECDLIFYTQKALGWLGISFDSGGGMGSRDWQTDWPFKYNPDQIYNNENRDESLDWLKDTLDEVNPIE